MVPSQLNSRKQGEITTKHRRVLACVSPAPVAARALPRRGARLAWHGED